MTWWTSRRPEDDPKLAELIKPPRILFTGCDEGLRERTEKRRQAAERIRQRAQRVESGSPVSDILRMVK